MSHDKALHKSIRILYFTSQQTIPHHSCLSRVSTPYSYSERNTATAFLSVCQYVRRPYSIYRTVPYSSDLERPITTENHSDFYTLHPVLIRNGWRHRFKFGKEVGHGKSGKPLPQRGVVSVLRSIFKLRGLCPIFKTGETRDFRYSRPT